MSGDALSATFRPKMSIDTKIGVVGSAPSIVGATLATDPSPSGRMTALND